MKTIGKIFCRVLPFFFGGMLFAQTPSPATKAESQLLTVEGTVQVRPVGGAGWGAGQSNQTLRIGDRLRTGVRSRATVRLSDLSVLRVNELTTLQIRAPQQPGKQSMLDLNSGSTYFLSRSRPPEQEFRTPLTSGAIRGTEFNLAVADDGRTVLTLIDGEVGLSNSLGQLEMKSGEQGVVDPGQPPVKTAMLEAVNIIQWCLYYPGVLNADELAFTDEEKKSLADSLAAYRAGDLLQALALCPWEGEAGSEAVRIYRAALLLSVGQAEKSGALLRGDSPQAEALRQVIAVTKYSVGKRTTPPTTASEWLAESYARQARGELQPALAAARAATTNAPNFGFAWERVAELEFGFGRTDQSRFALDRALQLSPRNAQALALRGFLLSAQNKIPEALNWFDQAIALDGGLGNAWLGRGLCLIHEGHRQAGLRDLVVAASTEPSRSLLRSYLGKAFADAGNDQRAEKELQLARKLDPQDPTTWLYSALLKQQENRINEAVADLQTSQEKNDNRSLFRSRLLLDQDRAVSSANLATIYRDLGMTDVSVREASRAVTSDYANDSAHLFLSDAYNDLRDPTQFNLRYETVYFNELLLANILAPIGGGRLAQGVSQQEYSKLFEADGFHLANSSDYRSDRMFHEVASQYGTFGNTSYSLDLDYRNNKGVRPNNGLDDIFWNTTIKQQVTPQDTALLLVQYQTYHSGDNFQYYNPSASLRPNFTFDESQQPILVGSWHHEWSPGMHTLALFGRLVDNQQFRDTAAPQLLEIQDPTGAPAAITANPLDVHYQNDFEIYSAEINQIAEWDRVTLSVGGRFQTGTFHAQDLLENPPPGLALLYNTPPGADVEDDSFRRLTGYGYLTVEPLDHLWLTAGVAYDEVTYPNNYRSPPVSSGEAYRSQLGPKAGFVWSPIPQATLRGIYARSLGGVSLDESYRLEQTQIAGFPQAFRSLISESIVGSVSAPAYEVLGIALDLKLGSRTYVGFQAQRLGTTVQRTQGILALQNGDIPAASDSTPEYLDYREYSLGVNVNQLLGDNFVIGASYHLTQADLHDLLGNFTGVPFSVVSPDVTDRSHLHQITGYILYNHPSGFFAKAETQWYEQQNDGFVSPEPGDEFFQQNFFAGYRCFDRRVELTLAILNATSQDYRLSPLTVYQELPRKRVFEARLNFIF